MKATYLQPAVHIKYVYLPLILNKQKSNPPDSFEVIFEIFLLIGKMYKVSRIFVSLVKNFGFRIYFGFRENRSCDLLKLQHVSTYHEDRNASNI